MSTNTDLKRHLVQQREEGMGMVEILELLRHKYSQNELADAFIEVFGLTIQDKAAIRAWSGGKDERLQRKLEVTLAERRVSGPLTLANVSRYLGMSSEQLVDIITAQGAWDRTEPAMLLENGRQVHTTAIKPDLLIELERALPNDGSRVTWWSWQGTSNSHFRCAHWNGAASRMIRGREIGG